MPVVVSVITKIRILPWNRRKHHERLAIRNSVDNVDDSRKVLDSVRKRLCPTQNSPVESKETPQMARNSVDNVDDSRKVLDSVAPKLLCPTQEQGSLPSSTANVNDSREVQEYRSKDKESTGTNKAIVEYRFPTRTALNPVGSEKMSLEISPGHVRLRMGERSLYPSECRQVIEHGTIMPYNRRHPGNIVYEWRGKRVSVLARDRDSSTKTICTVFDTNVHSKRERIANFLNPPIHGDYEDDDQYDEAIQITKASKTIMVWQTVEEAWAHTPTRIHHAITIPPIADRNDFRSGPAIHHAVTIPTPPHEDRDNFCSRNKLDKYKIVITFLNNFFLRLRIIYFGK